MERCRRILNRQLALSALVMCGFFAVTTGLRSMSVGAIDIPSVNPAPEPRSIDQQIKLANDYLIGHGVTRDLQQSAYWFEKAAEAGDPQAQTQIGYFYDAGIGVPKDPVLAAHWYQLAAAGGFIDAKVNLGVLYLWGKGVKKNEQLAVQLFREAAEKGSGLAACYLGEVYRFGLSVPEDKAVSEQWYARGAELHNPQAEYKLGLFFFDYRDHAHDLHKAAGLFRASAAAGDVPAMFALGLLLARNPDLAKSPDEPIRLLNVSADAGLWKSSMILGVLTRDGKGVPANDSEAYYHFRAAALQGGDDAKRQVAHDLQELTEKLGPAKTGVLDARAENWYQQHHIKLEFVYEGGESRAKFPDYALAVPENGTHTMQMLPALLIPEVQDRN
jgi:hypothetical protein